MAEMLALTIHARIVMTLRTVKYLTQLKLIYSSKF